ncbi:MAG: molybdenum cofactor guanylyltransferase [Bilophila sp.]
MSHLTNQATGAPLHLVGVVLAGGLSTRLGADKKRLFLHQDGDMLAHSVALLQTCVPEVLVSCQAGADLPYVCLPDDVAAQGPVGALYTVLRHVQNPILVLSCDLPFMDTTTLQRLIAAHEKRAQGALMTTFQQAETGYIEALVAVYEPACLPLFAAAQGSGQRQLNRVVPATLREHIRYEQQDALPFFNLNTPADLAIARRIVAAS